MSRVAIEGNASGSGTFTIAAPNSNNNRTISIPDGTGTMVVNGASSSIVADTAKSATSTSVDFTGIPSWVKRITVMFSGVSTNGTSNPLIQLGDAGGIENTGYTAQSAVAQNGASTTGAAYTTGFGIVSGLATNLVAGVFQICLVSGNTWVLAGSYTNNGATASAGTSAGYKTLSDTLTQVRITTVGGTDAFDAGTINILYE